MAIYPSVTYINEFGRVKQSINQVLHSHVIDVVYFCRDRVQLYV